MLAARNGVDASRLAVTGYCFGGKCALELHGADDPYVKQDEVTRFRDEMRAANVDWQLVQYSGAVHGFTDDRAGSDNAKGAAYNANADKRSWQAMKSFLAEKLAR